MSGQTEIKLVIKKIEREREEMKRNPKKNVVWVVEEATPANVREGFKWEAIAVFPHRRIAREFIKNAEYHSSYYRIRPYAPCGKALRV